MVLLPVFGVRVSVTFQVVRKTIKVRTSSKFGPTRTWTAELAAVEPLEKYS